MEILFWQILFWVLFIPFSIGYWFLFHVIMEVCANPEKYNISPDIYRRRAAKKRKRT